MPKLLFSNRWIALGWVAFTLFSIAIFFSDDSGPAALTSAVAPPPQESATAALSLPVEPEVRIVDPPADDGFTSEEELANPQIDEMDSAEDPAVDVDEEPAPVDGEEDQPPA